MGPMFAVLTGFFQSSFSVAACCVAALFFSLISVSAGQSTNRVKSAQEVTRTAQEKSVDAARSAPSARHFDRVVVIVLENGDYEAAIKDPNLAALAAQGASFSN